MSSFPSDATGPLKSPYTGGSPAALMISAFMSFRLSCSIVNLRPHEAQPSEVPFSFTFIGRRNGVVGSKAPSTQQSSPCGLSAAVLPFIYLWSAFLANLAAAAAFRALANAQRLLVAGATLPPASPERARRSPPDLRRRRI
jgi:hypothetical protein